MKDRFIGLYMDIAVRVSKMSRARRLQVGAIVVKDERIISVGFNGTPTGWDNNCEDVIQLSDDTVQLKTKSEVLHAEMNALFKLAKSNESGEGADLFMTHTPCMQCAKGIYQAGIKRVFYRHAYRDNEGAEFLKKCNVSVIQVNMSENEI